MDEYEFTDDDVEVLRGCGFIDYGFDISYVPSELVVQLLAVMRQWLQDNGKE